MPILLVTGHCGQSVISIPKPILGTIPIQCPGLSAQSLPLLCGPTFAFFTEGHFLGFLNPERMLLGPLNGFASGSISLLMLSSSLNNSSATELVGDRAEEEEEEEEEDDEDPKAVNTVLVEGGATVVTSSSTSSSSSCSSVATSSFFPPRSFLFANSAFVKEIGGRGNPCPELWG